MPTVTMASKLASVAGRSAAKIEKAFGFRTVGDLLGHYPRRYVDKGSLSDLSDVEPGEHVTVIGRVVSSTSVPYEDRRRGGTAYRLEVRVATATDELALTFFDKARNTALWREKSIATGTSGLFSGKLGTFRGRWQLTNPENKIFAGETMESALDQAQAEWAALPPLLTIYPASAAVQTWQLEDAIGIALDLVEDFPEVLPPAVRLEHGLLSARQALEWIHRPGSWQEKGAAERRLRFDEAFITQTVLAQRRAELMALPAEPRTGASGGLLDRFDQRVPFELTEGQRVVSGEILDDLAAGHPMHRLLQGEVGSGKTVVALRAMLRVIDSGAQAVLLAPTEVLALQHHRSITAMLGGEEGGTRVGLLTGSLGAAARKTTLLDAASGAAGIVVGTHALLEEKVQFADLGLVVVDEQHRFGVEQRAALAAKAGEVPPHVLVMTATPIPRTVAMTVFGDLETSTLTELPAGRAPIQSTVVPMADHPGWIERAWTRIGEEVAQGRQAYVVCPRISGELAKRGNEPDDQVPPAGAEEVGPALREGALRGLTVEVLHGRLSAEHKDATMRAFAAGEIDVLVSTTVIEVGVDVANATVMVILDAERFGVSALHQLRGRVGRGGHPGLCLLVTRAELGTPARARLEAVAATGDGFKLARLDLEQRREGDVLGASQSGRRSGLRLLSVLQHEDVIVDARRAAAAVVDADPRLATHPDLGAAARALNESEQADYLEKA